MLPVASALYCMPSATFHVLCEVLLGFTFFLSQAAGVVLCVCALHCVWSCWVLPSLCPSQLIWLCVSVGVMCALWVMLEVLGIKEVRFGFADEGAFLAPVLHNRLWWRWQQEVVGCI